MNIFVLDKCPHRAAQMLHDVHVRKMITESLQMLCTVAISIQQDHKLSDCYRMSHKNHPCTLWAGHSQQNFDWLVEHAIAQIQEYDYRFPGNEDTKYQRARSMLTELSTRICLEPRGFTPFAQAMPDAYKNTEVTLAYQTYYNMEKHSDKNGKRIDNWTKRDIPSWYDPSHLKHYQFLSNSSFYNISV